MSLYRVVKRSSAAPVTVVVRGGGRGERVRAARESQGQPAHAFDNVVDLRWEGGLAPALAILDAHCRKGAVHVFSGCQADRTVRELVAAARARGARIAVYDEAPCEMCTGPKALLKRLYYRWILPRRMRKAVSAADVFLNASGEKGADRLLRLGWPGWKIVPFGYSVDGSGQAGLAVDSASRIRDAAVSRIGTVRILHTGAESPYRGVQTLERASGILKRRGIAVEVKRTRGKVPPERLRELYAWADVFVACGLCEPWGIRVNDAVAAGLPVFVSDGMGSRMIVERTGCGCVFGRERADELASCIERFALDSGFRRRIVSGTDAARVEWSPETRASVFLDAISR